MTIEMIDRLWKARNQVRDGYSSALDLHIELRKLQSEVAEVLAEIREEALQDAQEYKGQTYKGCKIDIRNSAGRWDYKDCVKVTDAQEKLKAAQKFHQNLVAPVVDPQTGEMYEPAHKKQGRETLFIS